MSKRILVGAIVLILAMSALALAGPYFTAENKGTTFDLTFTGGVDYSFAVQTDARAFLDAHWDAPASDLTASVVVGLTGFKVGLETILDWNRPVSNFLGWDTSLTLTGYIFTGLKVWGGMSFDYTPAASPAWALVPVFGIEGRW